MSNIKVPITIDDNGIVLDAGGVQIASIMPLGGKRRAIGAEIVETINLGRRPRTDQEIVDQTNDIARIALRCIGTGYEVPAGFLFYNLPTKHDPRADKAWEFARELQLFLTDTDPNDALTSIDIDEGKQEFAQRITMVRHLLGARWHTMHLFDGTANETALQKHVDDIDRRLRAYDVEPPAPGMSGLEPGSIYADEAAS